MIELKNIQVEFSRDGASATAAVDDVSLTILEGEVFGIIGSSGAGKSTLVRTINPRCSASSGRAVPASRRLCAPSTSCKSPRREIS